MLYTILIFRDFIFKENALFTYFVVLFLYKTVKTTESILNSDDRGYPFLIFRLFVFVLPKYVFLCSVLFFAQSITVVISIIFGVVVCQQYHVCPRNIPRTFRKMSTFNHETPHISFRQTQGTDSSYPYFHIIKYAYSFPRTRMSTLSNTYIHSTTHVCSFLILRFFHICGHDKSDPYGY